MKFFLNSRVRAVHLGLYALITLLVGCGGGDDTASVVSIPANLALRSLAEPVGSNCAAGGKQILVGADANSDGVLQDSEMSQSFFVCDGVLGTTGAQGATGTVGAAGPIGSDGSAGPIGSPGPTGPQGPAASSPGTPGPTGPQGSTGAQGAAGPVGPGGLVGADGSTFALTTLVGSTRCGFITAGIPRTVYQITVTPTTGIPTVAALCGAAFFGGGE
jgi:hypothetical protein